MKQMETPLIERERGFVFSTVSSLRTSFIFYMVVTRVVSQRCYFDLGIN